MTNLFLQNTFTQILIHVRVLFNGLDEGCSFLKRTVLDRDVNNTEVSANLYYPILPLFSTFAINLVFSVSID